MKKKPFSTHYINDSTWEFNKILQSIRVTQSAMPSKFNINDFHSSGYYTILSYLFYEVSGF